MSEETNKENNKNRSNQSSQEEERKKQFERMKEKFGRQSSNFGGGRNSGNNFYWIYGIVIAVLLFIVFYGNDFNSRLKEVPQSKFLPAMGQRPQRRSQLHHQSQLPSL